jgi:hypothetical protein
VNGCGSKTGTVFGRVIYQGKPVPGGMVNFLPQVEQHQGQVFSSIIDENGNYKVIKVPIGPGKITVQDPGGRRPMTQPKHLLPKTRKEYPKRYATPEGSDLTYTVAAGTQEHDIELK